MTVIIPTFNRWHLLRRALASVLTQVGVDLEVIVIDDGSRDDTLERLAEVRDDRLRILSHADNRGVAVARNRGLSVARAPWVAFLDDDDFWAPSRLCRHLETARATQVGWTYGSFVTFTEAGLIRSVSHAVHPDRLDRGLFSVNLVGTPSTVTARTRLVEKAGGFDPELSVLADWDLWLRLKDLALAAAVGEPLLAYAAHPGNMQLTSWSTVPDELRHMTHKYGERAAAAGVPFARETLDEWTARDYRRQGRRWRASSALLTVGLRYGSREDVLRAAALPFGEKTMSFLSDRKPRAIPETPFWLREGLEAALPTTIPAAISPTGDSG